MSGQYDKATDNRGRRVVYGQPTGQSRMATVTISALEGSQHGHRPGNCDFLGLRRNP